MGFFVSVSSFLQALKGRRGLALAKEVADHIRKQVDSDCDASFDPLAQHQVLDGFYLYASDGHYEEAAAHAKPVRGQKYAPAPIPAPAPAPDLTWGKSRSDWPDNLQKTKIHGDALG